MHRSDIIQKNLRRFDSMEITESAKVLDCQKKRYVKIMMKTPEGVFYHEQAHQKS